MAMTRWEPFRESPSLQNVFERFFNENNQSAAGPRMALNAHETEEGLVFEASVPGAKKDDFEISYKDQFLTIKATLQEQKAAEGTRFHLREITHGEASRTLRLPFPVDADKAKAEYSDGVLKLSLPKSEAARPRSIPIS